jgi:hypothetical protein
MDDRPDVGPLAIDFQMKQDFAGAAFISRDLIPLKVNRAQVLRLKKAFAVQGRGAEDFVVGQATTQVSFISGTKLSVVHPTTDFTHLFP